MDRYILFELNLSQQLALSKDETCWRQPVLFKVTFYDFFAGALAIIKCQVIILVVDRWL